MTTCSAGEGAPGFEVIVLKSIAINFKTNEKLVMSDTDVICCIIEFLMSQQKPLPIYFYKTFKILSCGRKSLLEVGKRYARRAMDSNWCKEEEMVTAILNRHSFQETEWSSVARVHLKNLFIQIHCKIHNPGIFNSYT